MQIAISYMHVCVFNQGCLEDFGGLGHLEEMGPLCNAGYTISMHHTDIGGISNAYVFPQHNTIHSSL